MKRKIFISYRRGPNSVVPISVEQIALHLQRRYGSSHVFLDRDGLVAGEPFQSKISQWIDDADLAIVIIGADWVRVLLERQSAGVIDWSRCEVKAALDAGIPVIPVFVDGATFPEISVLPDDVKPLFDRHGIRFLGGLEIGMAELFGAIDEAFGGSAARASLHHGIVSEASLKRGRIAVLVGAFVLIAMVVWREDLPAWARSRDPNFPRLLCGTAWITYDPVGMRLDQWRVPRYDAATNIAFDLDRIVEAGYGGVVISSALDVLSDVPRLAKQRKLKVIVGVWNARDLRELVRASRLAEWTDAYVVGTSQSTEGDYVASLRSAASWMRKRTGRPTAVSELAIRYAGVADASDFFFPDAHLSITDGDGRGGRVDIDRDLAQLLECTRHVAVLAKQRDVPLLLNNVAYPYKGIAGATRERQAEFHRRLAVLLRDPVLGHPVLCNYVVQGAFDMPWKTGEPFRDWDPYAGVLPGIDVTVIDKQAPE